MRRFNLKRGRRTIPALKIRVQYGYGTAFSSDVEADYYLRSAHDHEVAKIGNRIVVGSFDPDGDPKYDDFNLVIGGPKTTARALEKILQPGAGELVVAGHYGREFAWVTRGQYVYVKAPCGQRARLTKAEVRRVLEALPELV